MRLIINADDFGFSKGINEGIIKSMTEGVVTNTTLLVNMPYTQHALELAKQHTINLGLHLNLTDGKPLAKNVNTLVDENGEFFPIGTLYKKLLLNHIKPLHIRREIDAQITFLKAQYTISHIDGHRYIQSFPQIMKILVKVAKKHSIRKLLLPLERLQPQASISFIKQLFVHLNSRVSKKYLKHMIYNEQFFGFLQISAKKKYKSFKEYVDKVSKTAELMTHPGFADNAIEKWDSYIKEREKELKILCSKRFKSYIEKKNIELISFNDL